VDQRLFSRWIENALKPLRQRIMMTVARGLLEAVQDDKGVQLTKISLFHEEVREGVERIQNFGFTSNPPVDSELVAVFVGGNREHGFVVATDHRASRKKNLQPGECAIYTDDGTYLILKKGGIVEVKAAASLTVDIPEATFTGKVTVQGDLSVDGKADVTGNVTSSANVIGGGTDLAAVKVFGTSHTHISGAPTTPTGPPVPPL